MSEYELLSELGTGAMGVVHLARHTSGKLVALKLLHADLAGDAEFLKRFSREVATIARLSHPALIKLYDAGARDGAPFYTMEYLEGAEPLNAVLRGHGALALDTALDAMRALLDALVYCHGEGVLHRDIKPGNIMFGPNERVTLMDFGLARQLESTFLTAPGALLGTPRYLAPEAIAGDLTTTSADVWSAGAIFYEMLSGRPAFEAKTINDVMREIMQVDPPPVSKVNTALPPSLDRLLTRFLEKDPAARWPSAKDALAALDGWSAGHGVRAPDSVWTTARLRRPLPRPAAIPGKRRARPEVQAVALAGVMLAVCVGGLALLRSSHPPSGLPVPSVAVPPPKPVVTAAEAGSRLRHRLQVFDPLGHLRWSNAQLRGLVGVRRRSAGLPPAMLRVWSAHFQKALAASGLREAYDEFLPVRDAFYLGDAVTPEDKRGLYEQTQLLIELGIALTLLELPLPMDARLLESTAYGPAAEGPISPLRGIAIQLEYSDLDLQALLHLAPSTAVEHCIAATRRLRSILDPRFVSPAEATMALFSEPAYLHPRPLQVLPGTGPLEVRVLMDRADRGGMRLLMARPGSDPEWRPFLFVRPSKGRRRHEVRSLVPDGVIPTSPFLLRAEVAYITAAAFNQANTEQDVTLIGIAIGRPISTE